VKRFVWLVILLIPNFLFGQARGKEGVVMTTIHGQVTYSDGRPAREGIQVQLSPSAGGISQEVQTDRTGKFDFQGLSPTRYTVRVHMPGFLDDEQSFDMSIVSSAYANLRLRPVPGSESVAPSGILAVLPSDMPESAKSEFNEGYNIVTSGKDLGKAVPHFKKAIEIYPKYAPAYLLLGTAYLRTDKADDAIPQLQKAIELDPKSADAYTLLGEIYNVQKKFPDAEQNLMKAVELAPTSFDAQYQLGRTCLAEQKAPEAQQHLEAALRANPNSSEAHIMMGNTMLRLRNAEAALKEYQEGVRLDPKGPMAEPAKQMIGKIQTALAAQKK
jgi:tetratricopeptide (TPR) repeat protein